jgi:hypothetical protein
MLDKSKGLVLGSEVVLNGDFATNSTASWTEAINGGTLNASTGQLVVNNTAGSGNTGVYQVRSCTAGQYIRVSIQVVARSEARLEIFTGTLGATSYSNNALTVGTSKFIVVPMLSSTFTVYAHCSAGNTATFDNISVKELPGNHAVQATTANRPIYGIHPVGGRRNLLTWSEDLTNAVWTKQNVTVSGTTVTSTSGLTSSIYQSLTAVASVYTFTFDIRAGTATTAVGVIRDQTAGINLSSTASIVSGPGSVSGTTNQTITGLSSTEWTRVRITLGSSATAGNSIWFRVFPEAASGQTGLSNNLRNLQAEVGSTATAYQRVTDQYNVTEAGVSSVSYLFFDGVNDSMATSTITPGVNKVQVFAGVRKLSDTLAGVLAELSATSASNNGSLILSAPFTSTNAGYGFGSRGTTRVVAEATSGFAAPITNVITGIGDISGDVSRLRANGAQIAADTTTDQGIGNFLAYPLYIGARNGSTLFFSGHLYSLVTRFGANLTADQIADTETWVAGETGFFTPVISGVPTVGVS